MRVIPLLLTALFSFGISSLAYSQTYDIELLNVNIPNTVVTGQMVPVSGDIKNNGPDDYVADSGFIQMNVHASYLPVADPYSAEQETSFKLMINRIDSDSTIPFTGEFLADVNNFQAGHSGITVIVWPRLGRGTDTDDKNHYYVTTTVQTVDSNSTDSTVNTLNSIDPQALLASRVRVYPNPARKNQRVSIELPESMEGSLSLVSLDGKVLGTWKVSPGQMRYSLSLAEVNATDGFYLIQFNGKKM
jgi:hypothetical protein